MTTSGAPDFPHSGLTPARRVWVGLTVLVAGVHMLLLQTVPRNYGQAMDANARTAPAFTTRSIETPRVVVAPAAAPPETAASPSPAAPAPKKPSSPRSVKAAPATAQTLTDFVAAQVLEPDVTSAPQPPADPAAVAGEPKPAAPTEAPPALPPGVGQTPVTAMALPPSAQLAYEMTGGAKGLTYHANAELNWNNSGTSYDARMVVSALFLGSRSMASTGQIGAEGLAPTKFSDRSRVEVAAHFETEKGQISFSANTPTLPLVKGTQDRVSVFLQLGGMLAGNPAGFPVGSSISLYTVGPRDADTWTFLVEAEETLRTPLGEFATVRLVRQPRREYDQKVEIWYAPSLGYLPVRNKITQQNGDFVDQQLKALNKP